jgi:predicted nucleotidyltransferase
MTWTGSASLLIVIDRLLVARLQSAADRLFAGTAVLAAYVFGSRVSGAPRPESDLDLGYYLQGFRQGDHLSIAEEMHLAGALSDAVGVSVDLHNLGDAPLELRGRVLEEGLRIYCGDPAARVGLERDLLARYHDYKDTFRQMHEIRLRALAERGF